MQINPQRFSPSPDSLIREAGHRALEAAAQEFTQLSLSGEGSREVGKNSFGQDALVADIRCEAAIINTLNRLGQQGNLVIHGTSEEHGSFLVGSTRQDARVLFAATDGLDGSGVFKGNYPDIYEGQGRARRFGTMLALYEGAAPTFSEYLFSGFIEHCSGDVFSAFPLTGGVRRHQGNHEPLITLASAEAGECSCVFLDTYYRENLPYQKKLSSVIGFETTNLFCSLAYYADIVSGKADALLSCTGKGNLELICAFGLVREAGGVVLTLEGERIDGLPVRTWGQQPVGPVTGFPVFLVAANERLGTQLIRGLQALL